MAEEFCDAEVQQLFPCVVAPFPCKYLGIPLSLRRLRRADEQPHIASVAARIRTWKAGLLTSGGYKARASMAMALDVRKTLE
jgi:hypothetical protein